MIKFLVAICVALLSLTHHQCCESVTLTGSGQIQASFSNREFDAATGSLPQTSFLQTAATIEALLMKHLDIKLRVVASQTKKQLETWCHHSTGKVKNLAMKAWSRLKKLESSAMEEKDPELLRLLTELKPALDEALKEYEHLINHVETARGKKRSRSPGPSEPTKRLMTSESTFQTTETSDFKRRHTPETVPVKPRSSPNETRQEMKANELDFVEAMNKLQLQPRDKEMPKSQASASQLKTGPESQNEDLDELRRKMDGLRLVRTEIRADSMPRQVLKASRRKQRERKIQA